MNQAFWIALLLGLNARCVLAQPYVEIKGELNWTVGWEGSTNLRSKTISILCVAGQTEWWVEHDFLMNGKMFWHYDGTNIYQTSKSFGPPPEYLTKRVSETTGLAVVPFEKAQSNLTVRVWLSSDGHPMGDAPANLVWLAFCSSSYLQREGRLVPLPVSDLQHTRDRFAYRDETETMPGTGLPQRLELYLSRERFLASEEDFDRQNFFGNRYTDWVRKTASTLPDGAHLFHYQVIARTNFLGRALPLEFEFWQGARKFEQNASWIYNGTSHVSAVRLVSRPAGLFNSRMQQTVMDYRFRDETNRVEALTYPTTNDFVQPVSDESLRKKFEQRVKQILRSRENRKKKGDGSTE